MDLNASGQKHMLSSFKRCLHLSYKKNVPVSLKSLWASGFNSPLEFVGTGECKDCFDWEKSAGKEGRNRRVAFPGKQTDFCFRAQRERRLSDCLSAARDGEPDSFRNCTNTSENLLQSSEAVRRSGRDVQTPLWINNQSQGQIMLAEALQLVHTCPIWKITEIHDTGLSIKFRPRKFMVSVTSKKRLQFLVD